MNLLPQMRRLAAQICGHYGLTAAKVTLEQEYICNWRGEQLHMPCYCISVVYPNAQKICELQCTPVAPSRGYYSMSNNNIMAYAVLDDGSKRILPSWRGKLITSEEELEQHAYHIRKGYMPVEADKHIL